MERTPHSPRWTCRSGCSWTFFVPSREGRSHHSLLRITSHFYKWWRVIVTPVEVTSHSSLEHPSTLKVGRRCSSREESIVVSSLLLGPEDWEKPSSFRSHNSLSRRFCLQIYSKSQSLVLCYHMFTVMFKRVVWFLDLVEFDLLFLLVIYGSDSPVSTTLIVRF